MTWTAPATAVTGNTLTAAFWNAQVRDNMLETAAATAAAAGDIVYADAANSMGSVLTHPGTGRLLVSDASNALAWRQPAEDVNFSAGSTSASTGSTSYTSVEDSPSSESFPSVTVTTGTEAIVTFGCRVASNNTGGEAVDLSFSISGATTSAASISRSTRGESDSANRSFTLCRQVLQSALTAGSNTFQVEALVSGGSGTVNRPYIVVQPL